MKNLPLNGTCLYIVHCHDCVDCHVLMFIYSFTIVLVNPPQRPVVVSTKNVQNSKIKVIWETKKENITTDIAFIIQLDDVTGRTEGITRTHEIQGYHTYTFTIVVNVKVYVLYRLRIKSCIHHNICSGFSEPAYIRSQEGPPSQVRNISILQDIDTVTVSWEKPLSIPGILRKYEINVKDGLKNLTGYPKFVSNITTTYTLTNLPAYKLLTAEVTPYTTQAGLPIQKRFLSAEGTPGPPSLFKVIESKGDIVLQWSPPINPNGIVLKYGVSEPLLLFCFLYFLSSFFFSFYMNINIIYIFPRACM